MESTGTEIYNSIQNFGDLALAAEVYGSVGLTSIEDCYRDLNPGNSQAIRDAVMLELQERGILAAFEIDDNGLNVKEGGLNSEEKRAAGLINLLEQMTGDNSTFVTELARLTDAGGEADSDAGQVALGDLEEALRMEEANPGTYNAGQVMAIHELQSRMRAQIEMDAMSATMFGGIVALFSDGGEGGVPNNDGFADGLDVGPNDIAQLAEMNGIVRHDSVELDQRRLLREADDTAQSDPVETPNAEEQRMSNGQIEFDLEPTAQIGDYPMVEPEATYTVKRGDGFDRIARAVYEEAYGERPSAAFEIELSKAIAELNGNDRDYSGGYIHPGDSLAVLTQAQIEALLEE